MGTELLCGRVCAVGEFGSIAIGANIVIVLILFVATAFRFTMSFWFRSRHSFLDVHLAKNQLSKRAKQGDNGLMNA